MEKQENSGKSGYPAGHLPNTIHKRCRYTNPFPLTSAEDKSEWIFTSISPYVLIELQ
jgi:hypothetical protein